MRNPRRIDTVIILTLIGGAIFLFLYYLTHYYQLPKPFLGKEIQTKAIVFNTSNVTAGRGFKFQNIGYVYEIEGEWFSGSATLGKKNGPVSAGDDISIVVDSWISGNSRISDDMRGSGFVVYPEPYCKTPNGYDKMMVSPSTILLKRFTHNGVLVSMEFGIVTDKTDSLIAFNWIEVDLIGAGDYKFFRKGQELDTLSILTSGYQHTKTGLIYK